MNPVGREKNVNVLRPVMRWFLIACCAALVALATAARGGEPLAAAAVRTAAGPRVCLVRAENGLGVPMGYASGFLLGAGKFVVTDLATLTQPGVRRVTLRFEDGATVVATQFGMADPATGLVAVLVEKPDAARGGLGLSTAATAADTPVVVVGWELGEVLDVAVGSLHGTAAAADVAAEAKIDVPQGAPEFLALAGPRLGVAGGAAVLDASGGVVGVWLDVLGSSKQTVVPAGALRGALLSAGTQLKALSELPKPVWPVAVDVLPGKPVNGAVFAGLVRSVKSRSRCRTCAGTGQIMVSKVVGKQRVGGMVRNIVRKEAEPCKTCSGETVVCDEGLYGYYAKMAEGAVRLTLSPDNDDKVKQAAVENGSSLLAALAKVGIHYRDGLISQACDDLARPAGEFPRGVVVYAQVGATVETADGKFTLLAPLRSSRGLVVRSEELTRPLADEAGPTAAMPGEGDWIILMGLAEGAVTLEGQSPVFVRTFGWTWGPSLGPRPAHVRPKSTGDRPPPPERDKKSDFFGL